MLGVVAGLPCQDPWRWIATAIMGTKRRTSWQAVRRWGWNRWFAPNLDD